MKYILFKKKTVFVKELFANNLLNLKTMTSILRIPSKKKDGFFQVLHN